MNNSEQKPQPQNSELNIDFFHELLNKFSGHSTNHPAAKAIWIAGVGHSNPL